MLLLFYEEVKATTDLDLMVDAGVTNLKEAEEIIGNRRFKNYYNWN
jgi:hypothetical protein